jgi:hypothetical protein
MTIEPIGILTLLIGLIGLYLESTFIVYAFVASTLLGSAGAIILDSLGGTNIQPAHLLLGFLAFKLLSDRNIAALALRGCAAGRPGFWLMVTFLYSIVTAYFLPRLFAGQTLVYTVRALGYSVPLEPGTSNLTQSVYFTGNFVCFIVLYGYGSSSSGRKHLVYAVLGCVALNLVFAVLDMVTFWTGTTELLSFIRNSTYAMFPPDTEVGGFKRIAGSFVEASSFGYTTLGYFAFASTLWLYGIAPALTMSLSLCSFTALMFSTSTTAYVGLAAFLALGFLATLVRSLFRPPTPQMIMFLVGAPIVLSLTVIVIALNDEWAAYATNLLDTMILSKASTSSGAERATWNAQGLQNFIDTFGFGTGNGSMRASSFPIAALASFGIIGVLTFGLFMLSIWTARKIPETAPRFEAASTKAARSACLAWLMAASTSGSLTDLGLPFFILAALACVPLQHHSTKTAPFVSWPTPRMIVPSTRHGDRVGWP